MKVVKQAIWTLGVIGAWLVVMASARLAHVALSNAGFKADSAISAQSQQSAADSCKDCFKSMSVKEVSRVLADHLTPFPRSQADRLAAHLLDLSAKYEMDPALILAMMRVESEFRIKVISPVGAVGLMQLMPATAKVISEKYGIRYTGARSLTDPFTNVSIGVAYLHYLREKYRGQSPYFHLAAYNMGPTKLDKLRKNPDFKPGATWKYFEKILKTAPKLRFYGFVNA